MLGYYVCFCFSFVSSVSWEPQSSCFDLEGTSRNMSFMKRLLLLIFGPFKFQGLIKLLRLTGSKWLENQAKPSETPKDH